jgi:hypothetical protein
VRSLPPSKRPHRPGTAPALGLRAGQPVDRYVFALDAYGHLASDYTGTVAFLSTLDPAAAVPAPIAFSPGGLAYIAGAVTFSSAGLYDLWAFDTTSLLYGLTFVTVVP